MQFHVAKVRKKIENILKSIIFLLFLYIQLLSTDFFIHRLSQIIFNPLTFLSTDYHRFPQIIKYQRYFDYHRFHSSFKMYSSFFIFWHGNPRLFQSHGLAPHRYNHGTSWLRLACASSLLSLFFCANEPCLYFV